MLIAILLFIIGLIIIIKGGDLFVDSAVWFAKVTGMPNILIGATIVSLATTLPELFVSTIATYRGAPEVAIGNAVGSSICNLGLILALSMLFMPGAADKGTLKKKGLLMIFSTLVVFFLSFDMVLSVYEGFVLISLLVVYVYMNVRDVKGNKSEGYREAASELVVSKDRKVVIVNVLQFVFGAIFIVLGARLLVDNGIIIAEALKIPAAIISVTLIALGTSLPELVTTITAIVKKHHDISVGNIIGANILNATMILGVSSLTAAEGLVITERTINILNRVYVIPQTIYIDIPVSLVLMFIAIIPSIISGRLKRWQGGMMLFGYVGYLVFLAVTI
jgi:cation:H+ antiporter